jgi:hypothetical protein
MNDLALVTSICQQREQFYRDIVQANPAQAKYLTGWLRRISEMRAFTGDANNTFA